MIGLVIDLGDLLLDQGAPDVVAQGPHPVFTASIINPLACPREAAQDHGVTNVLVEEVDAEMFLYAREIEDAIVAVDSLALELLQGPATASVERNIASRK